MIQYLNKPWVAGAQGPDAYDCYGLVRAVLREQCGIEAPLVAFDATRAHECFDAIKVSREASVWSEIPGPKDYAVVLLGHGKRPHHVGIVVPGGRVLHTTEKMGSELYDSFRMRLAGWKPLAWYEWVGG